MNNSKPIIEQANADAESPTSNVILHISDLHFIKNTNDADVAKNNNIQRDLIRQILKHDKQWMPNIICITGDISDKNKEDGYKQAAIFIRNLAKSLSVPTENLIICPGNHDFDRKEANKLFRKKTIQDVIDNFKIPISVGYDKIFSNYISFCESLDIPKCIYGDHASYLFGIRKVGDINFIICNSNWYYSKKPSLFKRLVSKFVNSNIENQAIKNSEDAAWICQPLLEYLEDKHDLLRNNQEYQDFFIGLLHHPSEELDDKEKYRRSSSKSPPAAVYLAERVGLVLTGHMHGLPLGLGSFLSADSINCGSTLQESSVDKAFYVLKITDYQIRGISFKYDPQSCKNKWIRDGEEFDKLTPMMQHKITELIKTDSQLISTLANSVSLKPPTKSEGLEYETDVSRKTNANEAMNALMAILKKARKQIEKAEHYIKKLEYDSAFEIINEVEKSLEPLATTIQSNELSDIYTRISLIECVRTDILHHNKGVPEDYSVAKEYLKRAKNARRQ